LECFGSKKRPAFGKRKLTTRREKKGRSVPRQEGGKAKGLQVRGGLVGGGAKTRVYNDSEFIVPVASDSRSKRQGG